MSDAREAACETVRAAQRRLASVESASVAARAERNDRVRQALDEGVTAYRLAQITGLSQTAIAKIRDAR